LEEIEQLYLQIFPQMFPLILYYTSRAICWDV
jgi:hypothetical protein